MTAEVCNITEKHPAHCSGPKLSTTCEGLGGNFSTWHWRSQTYLKSSLPQLTCWRCLPYTQAEAGLPDWLSLSHLHCFSAGHLSFLINPLHSPSRFYLLHTSPTIRPNLPHEFLWQRFQHSSFCFEVTSILPWWFSFGGTVVLSLQLELILLEGRGILTILHIDLHMVP